MRTRSNTAPASRQHGISENLVAAPREGGNTVVPPVMRQLVPCCDFLAIFTVDLAGFYLLLTFVFGEMSCLGEL
jgi:hypothetical protein